MRGALTSQICLSSALSAKRVASIMRAVSRDEAGNLLLPRETVELLIPLVEDTAEVFDMLAIALEREEEAAS